jgi:chromosome segregation ATPase
MKLRPIAVLVLGLGLGTAVAAPGDPAVSRDAVKAEKARIAAEYKSDKERCGALAGNAKDVCEAEARAKQRIAEADLEAQAKNTPKARYDARVARAEAEYQVAKERCDDLAGNAKDVCLKEAKAAETKAKADANAERQASEARRDAAAAKLDADYRVALERCDTFSGDAKDACVREAKVRFGKS